MLATVLCCATAGHIVAQAYHVKKCETPKSPLGVLHGVGQVSYLLRKDGRPDTTSVRVVAVDSISPGGFRSAAIRQLSGCELDSPSHAGQSVLQTLHFDGVKASLSAANATAELESDFVMPPPHLPDAPIASDDSLLEERPLRLKCPAPMFPSLPTNANSIQAIQDAAAATTRDYAGWVRLHMTVGADGRVLPESVVVDSSNNSMLSPIYVRAFRGCSYAPGRIGGIPVQTIVHLGGGYGGIIMH